MKRKNIRVELSGVALAALNKYFILANLISQYQFPSADTAMLAMMYQQ